MRIFISHSSRQKLFVNDIIRRLPHYLEYWIDQEKILMGDNLREVIKAAIFDCEFFLLVLDESASRSEWVRWEITCALEKEQRENEPMLLPLVVDHDALVAWPEFKLKERKYLSINTFEDRNIDMLCDQIVEELFAKLVRIYQNSKSKVVESKLEQARKASETLVGIAALIRHVLYEHRRDSPISTEELRNYLNKNEKFQLDNISELLNLLQGLKASGLLKGYYFDSDFAYMSVERVNTKSDLNVSSKRIIGRKAAALLSSGMRIGIDGGSTTLHMTHEIVNLITSGGLSELEVVTNSIPAASMLLEALNLMDVGDKDRICRVNLIGGWCRPISMTAVPSFNDFYHDQSEIGSPHKGLDIAFLGANGICDGTGFGNTHAFELPAKKQFSSKAVQSVFLMESRKLRIQQSALIEQFSKKTHLITDSQEIRSPIAMAVLNELSQRGGTLSICENSAELTPRKG